MTHTLHPEIEKHIQRIIIDIHLKILPGLEKHNVTLTKEHFCFIRDSIREHLGPYLKMPQPIENEPLPENQPCKACLGKKQHSVCSQEIGHDDFGGEGYVNPPQVKMIDCKRCNGTGQDPVYDAKPKTYTLQQMEEEYDRGFTNGLLAIGGEKDDLKQSTPQIELPAYVLNNLDYLGLLLDKMIEKSKSHLDKLKSLDK